MAEGKRYPKPLLVGEAPPRSTEIAPERRSPLFPRPTNSAGGRLQRMTGLSASDYLHRFHRLNLLPHAAFAERWSAPAAREAACNLLNGWVLEERVVVLVGARVFAAFKDLLTLWDEPLRTQLAGGMGGPRAVIYLPHPSGRNRWYNDPENRAAAEALMRNIAKDD